MKTVESILSQTWRDFEWIIIDGGSTDGGKEYIINLNDNLNQKGWNPISFWCSEPDKGIYNALNKGIQHCHGEYVSCMNSGDIFYAENTICNVFSKKMVGDVLYGNCSTINNGEINNIVYGNIDLYYLYKYNVCHQAMFVKRNLYIENGFDESLKITADYALWLRFAVANVSFEYVNETICLFDMTGYSNNPSIEHQHIEERKRAQETIIPPIILLFLKRCKDYESDDLFISFRDIRNGGGVTYLCMCLFFRLVKKYAQIKKFFCK